MQLNGFSRRGFFALLAGSAAAAPLVAKTVHSAPRPPELPTSGVAIAREAARKELEFIGGLKPEWLGDSLDHSFTAQHFIRMIPRVYLDVCRKSAAASWEFFQGEQWDTAVMSERSSECRPSLVINYLPMIAGRAVQNSEKAGEPDLTDDEMELLMVAVVMRNADPQRLFNYILSRRVEEQSLVLPNPRLATAWSEGYHRAGPDGAKRKIALTR